MSLKPILFRNGKCLMIDQRLLPAEEIWREFSDYREVAEAIRTMVVRGAPAIGVAAAFGAAFGARDIAKENFNDFYSELEKVCAVLASTRPTAVNLSWALERMKNFARMNKNLPVAKIKRGLLDLAQKIAEEDERINRAIGTWGERLVPHGARILTHCNAGALATAGFGTALGIVRAAAQAGKKVRVFVDETRPWLQGARLTAWELQRDGIPVTLICDNMAGFFMSRREIDCVIVGADRIAANGDVANKIGTYPLAVLCKEHKLPFYVAAPVSTIDFSLPDGSAIPIEERDPEEVLRHGATRLALNGIEVRNPAFDITPAHLVTAIITERGIVRGRYGAGFKVFLGERDK